MNTVFKFYLQAWVLYGLVGAFALWYLATSSLLRPWRRWWPVKSIWLGLVLLLVLCAGIYPLLGTRARLQDRFQVLPLTLNGIAFMEKAVFRDPKGPIELRWDAQAMDWLKANVKGSPVVLEAALSDNYRWGSRVSIYTGLPTVIGWQFHQSQQRPGYEGAISTRARDVREIYSTTDPKRALELLRQYQVSYLYVGPVERLYYPSQGLEKFGAMVGKGLSLEYENPQVKIYRVAVEES